MNKLFNENDLDFLCIYKECESRCCKNNGRRFVLLSDLERLIAAGLQKHVLGKYPSSEVAQNLLDRPQDLDYYREHYVMPYLENKNIDKQDQCIFLNKDYTCGIYENRPSVCRVYPFSIQTQSGNPQIATHTHKLCPPNAKGEVDKKFLTQIALDLIQDAQSIKETLHLLAKNRTELIDRGFGAWL